MRQPASETDLHRIIRPGIENIYSMLRALKDKADNMPEQMGNVSRDGNPKIKRKYWRSKTL